MGFKKCLFSEVNGVVLRDGQPVVGALIDREVFWVWNQESIRDSTTTDAQGRFSLPAIERISLLGSFLPHEPVLQQGMRIIVDGNEFEAYGHYKGDYNRNSENNGQPSKMTCELTSEPTRRGEFYGLCVLDGAP